MTWLDAALLGILEGLTEFLPVSSTGHLILLGEWLGHNDEAAKTLEIVIQLGAVLAVVVAYRDRLKRLALGLLQKDPESLRLLAALAIGFVPAGLSGYFLHRAIKDHLFGPKPVAAGLIAGGAVMILIEAVRSKRGEIGLSGVEHVTPKRALVIGLFQCFSLWPGTSRSMSTIVGGQIAGLSTATAAEFSFLLAIPTLGAATLFDLLSSGKALLQNPGFASAVVAGLATSFAVALLVIAAFIRYLRRFGLAPFGVYRIALGALVLALVKPPAESPAGSLPAALEAPSTPPTARAQKADPE
jgi:undecaprenyl-diphosphatase